MDQKKKCSGHLLIVEDELDLLFLLEDLLEDFTDEITIAKNGLEAHHLIQKNRFDAILSDISMPEMTGLELLAKLRAEKNFTPFIIVSGFGDEQKTIEALNNGAMDFLTKPWHLPNLEQVVGRALELGLEMKRWDNEGFALQSIEDLRKFTAELAIESLLKREQ